MSRATVSLVALAAPLLLVVGCSAATQRAYIAPTRETIVSTTEERQADPPSHLIFVENHSTVPVRVFSVYLRGCENVRQRCDVQPVNIPIGAGQKRLALRVEPENKDRGFGYQFGFSWHADSSSAAALAALAATGDSTSRERLAAIQRADSIRRTEKGPQYNELSRDDFAAIAARAVSLRADPESLVLEPGQRSTIDRIRLLVLDKEGTVLGRTRWMRWFAPTGTAVQFLPPDNLVARSPGRSVIRFRLADEAQKLLANPVPELEYAVVAAYPADPHAPTYAGRAVDADSRTPLVCARVALEDSAQNVVARERTVKDGLFYLSAPRPGTYRVRVETFGWAPVYGPNERGKPDETVQHEYAVRFTEQMLSPRFSMQPMDFEHARPAAVTVDPLAARASGARGGSAAAPIVSGVTLGGSESMPILGIVGRAPAGTTWMQFVVDSTGRVDTTSIQLPAGADKVAVSSVTSVLPRVRFSPARDAGRPTCELLRMQVNFTPRP